MPADYLAVRDSCYKSVEKETGTLTDKQKSECKKKAAIWYFKKHGKPVNDSTEASLKSFEVNDLDSISDILDDNPGIEINTEGTKIVLTFASETLNFTQPFEKSDAEYLKYEDRTDTMVPSPMDNNSEDSVDSSNNETIKYCGDCVHFIYNQFGQNVLGEGDSEYERNFCHLVKGYIDDMGICKYHAYSILESNNTSSASSRSKRNKKAVC